MKASLKGFRNLLINWRAEFRSPGKTGMVKSHTRNQLRGYITHRVNQIGPELELRSSSTTFQSPHWSKVKLHYSPVSPPS